MPARTPVFFRDAGVNPGPRDSRKKASRNRMVEPIVVCRW
jgi:hypothetical protein